jgi:hypothetical protein
MLNRSETALARVTHQLSRLEKRDWELWVIVSLTGVVVSIGLLAILFRAAFNDDTIHFEITVSRPLVIGLFILLALLNTYLVSKRFEVRRLREQLISSTLQHQVAEQQSFTDPLTEIYNRRALDQIADRFISSARRRKTSLIFMMIDADNKLPAANVLNNSGVPSGTVRPRLWAVVPARRSYVVTGLGSGRAN